jgi:hypothetical protein
MKKVDIQFFQNKKANMNDQELVQKILAMEQEIAELK